MAYSKQDIARLSDLARLQNLREDAAAARLSLANEQERNARNHATEAEHQAVHVETEFRTFLAAGRFEPGQYQVFGALLADHVRQAIDACQLLEEAQQKAKHIRAAHALARAQTSQINARLRRERGRSRRLADERSEREHLDFYITLQGAVRT